MSTIPATCIAAKDVSGKMILHKIHRRAVGPNDVHISITWSGICHSDIHTAKGEWGPQTYPLCVGHEIMGDVVAVGDKVSKFKVGEKAGVGCFTDSCRACEECKEGDEQYCTGPGGIHGTYGSKRPEELHPGGVTQGGYSSAIVVDENYVLKVPDNIYSAAGTPLLCAGITCFSPLTYFGLKPGMSLGVVGLGGLGHMAVKVGKAMGASVTVFSRSPGKKETALAMGATNFVISTNEEEMKKAAKSLNMIYDSIAFVHDPKPYLDCLRSSGKLIMVGGVPQPMQISPFQLLLRRLQVVGSCIGGIRETQEMLDFCSKHNITSDIELIKADPKEVDTAYERAIKGDVKYRFVIDTAATLPSL